MLFVWLAVAGIAATVGIGLLAVILLPVLQKPRLKVGPSSVSVQGYDVLVCEVFNLPVGRWRSLIGARTTSAPIQAELVVTQEGRTIVASLVLGFATSREDVLYLGSYPTSFVLDPSVKPVLVPVARMKPNPGDMPVAEVREGRDGLTILPQGTYRAKVFVRAGEHVDTYSNHFDVGEHLLWEGL